MSESVSSSSFTVNGSGVGTALTQMLTAADIVPGSTPSYQLCKTIFLYHPLGAKMAEAPINKAQAAPRNIEVTGHPDRVTKAFKDEWKATHADIVIHSTASQARVYGIASLVLGMEDEDSTGPLKPEKLAGGRPFFNVLDPLNTAGSLVLNQDPNAPDFQKADQVTTNGQTYHRSRVCVIMNERPIYIAYTSSSFGFVGRSVYQRALYPMKSFVQSMRTDDMISRKAGLLIAKMKPPGSIINRAMQAVAGIKRAMLKEGETDNVLSIAVEEDITSLNLQNIDGAGTFARTNILKNIATAADMPAVLLENETLVEGFGEGTEDAKVIADYIDRIREWLEPLYAFMDMIVQYRAWNKGFFDEMQKAYPETYGRMTYEVALTQWRNAFKAEWPSTLKEPDSERVKTDEVKLKAIISVVDSLYQRLDPDNRAALIDWMQANLNDTDLLFRSPLTLDVEALKDWIAEQQDQQTQMALQQQDDPEGGAGQAAETKPTFHLPKAA